VSFRKVSLISVKLPVFIVQAALLFTTTAGALRRRKKTARYKECETGSESFLKEHQRDI
jgi:hypothetical protein